jgi:hypothetical protein
MTLFLDEQTAMVCIAKLAAAGVFISCAEFLSDGSPLKDCGLMSWSVGSLRQRWLIVGPIAAVLHAVLRYPNVLGLLALRALLACLILLGPAAFVLSAWVVLPLALLTLLFNFRSGYGQDGADQMTWIIFAGLALVSIVATPRTRVVYLCFVAFQSCLAYATAGFAKASAQGWRDGSFLPGIFGSRFYGHQGLANLLRHKPALARLLARSLIVWESSFPLVLLAPLPLVLAVIVSGIVFHVLNAYFMGLNNFVWAFVAGYPAILYCVQHRGW